MKKLLLICGVISCLFIFTACEPNVDYGNENTSIGTTPGTAVNEEVVTGSTAPDLTEENYENREQTGTQAVGDNTSTAFFNASKNLKTTPLSTRFSNNKICWGLGKETDDKNRPRDAVSAQEKYTDLNALFIGEAANKIYLTFDEGYENGYTGEILDTLERMNVKATFFVTYDYCKSAPELVARMIAEGHEVGNHSYTHTSFPDCNENEVKDEIQKLHNYVSENFNYEMRLVRPPKGEFSERSLSAAKELGYASVFWSYAHVDWDVNNQPAVSDVYDKVTKATHPGGIVLLHAVSKSNTECLADIINFWQSCGYELALFDR